MQARTGLIPDVCSVVACCAIASTIVCCCCYYYRSHVRQFSMPPDIHLPSTVRRTRRVRTGPASGRAHRFTFLVERFRCDNHDGRSRCGGLPRQMGSVVSPWSLVFRRRGHTGPMTNLPSDDHATVETNARRHHPSLWFVVATMRHSVCSKLVLCWIDAVLASAVAFLVTLAP